MVDSVVAEAQLGGLAAEVEKEVAVGANVEAMVAEAEATAAEAEAKAMVEAAGVEKGVRLEVTEV